MKTLVRVNNKELSFRLKLNYNNVYSRLRMVLGPKASLFANLSTMAASTTWFVEDNASYSRMSEAEGSELTHLSVALDSAVQEVRKQLQSASELSVYVEDILEVPDNSFVFYSEKDGEIHFVLAAWGCMLAHQNATDPNVGFIRRNSKAAATPDPLAKPAIPMPDPATDVESDMPVQPEQKVESTQEPLVNPETQPKQNVDPATEVVSEPKPEVDVQPLSEQKSQEKLQHVLLRVLDQNNKPVAGEKVNIHVADSTNEQYTDDLGQVEVGNLPYGSVFSCELQTSSSFNRSFEVEATVEIYDMYIKKLVKYSPVLFVEDQHGGAVQFYNVKVVVNGQDSTYNTQADGVIQLPTMLEGQHFVVIDAANYANSQEYTITAEEAKKPYHFCIKRAEQPKVGITVLDASHKPIQDAVVSMNINDAPLQQATDASGRAEFPAGVFQVGDIKVSVDVKGKGRVDSMLKYSPANSEYTIQLQDKKPHPHFDTKWWRLLMALLLLFVLGLGGYALYQHFKKPSLSDMESGVVMILSQTSYSVELGLDDIKAANGAPLKSFYFLYDENSHEIQVAYSAEHFNDNFDSSKRVYSGGLGTGFLISKDGLIATNRHVAHPIAPEEVGTALKKYFQNQKEQYQEKANKINANMSAYGAVGGIRNQEMLDGYNSLLQQLSEAQAQIAILDKILNTGNFSKVEVDCRVSVAFTGTRVQTADDFVPASCRIYGEPGGVTENDLAIIQINKMSDMPDNAYIFQVPEKDPLDEPIPDNYKVNVLGYNYGLSLQDMDLQAGIEPQTQSGEINNKSEKYRIGYSAQLLGGSSGSPVLNSKNELVAVNNSGVSATQGFNYGIRIKYLRELLNELNKKESK